MHSSIHYLAFLLGIHTSSFLFEHVYQRWCYPITLQGFVLSLFTRSSTMCTALREMSTRMDTLFLHVVVVWITRKLVKCSEYFNKSN